MKDIDWKLLFKRAAPSMALAVLALAAYHLKEMEKERNEVDHDGTGSRDDSQ